ncbi:MAG: MBG domain-containing protein, partial [Verrucomicrobia bacterium]|nr:MBG domain-containing protein [Verrucomicrobiota bacterium]
NNGLINFNTASSVAVVNANSGTLGGTSPVTITGMLTMGGGRLTNPYVAANGGINFNGGGTLDGGKLVNSGTAIWSLGNITGANGAFFSNLAGATFNNTFDGNLPSGAGATPTFVNNGLFQKTGGSAVPGPTTTDFQFINTGTVEVRTNSLRYALNQQTAGITLLNGGGLDSQAVPIQFAGGTLMGTGLVTVANLQTVTNAATFSPGLPIGQLDITGNYFQTPAGALNIEIGGYQPGIEHDLVTVTSGGAGGSAALSGRLNISFVNGFVPTNGATFTILTALSRFGSFSSFNYPSNDIGLQLSYDATSAKVIVSNLKPVVAHPIANPAAITYGSAVNLQFAADTFSDPDNNALTYTALGLPSGASFSSATRTVSGTPTQAGAFTVQIVAADDGIPSLSVTNSFTLTVNPAPLTVTASAQSKTYGADLALGTTAFSTIGLQNGDTVTGVTLAASGIPAGSAALAPVGAYTITPSAATGSSFVASNYTITYTSGVLTVNPKAATVVANSKAKAYGDSNPVLDAVVTGTANGDVLAYTLATTATVNSGVGSYPITVTLGSNPNYSITPTGSTLAVSARPATVQANAKSKIYGAANPTLDAVVTGTANGDVLAYSLATTATVTSGVATYPITVTLGSNPNYSVAPSNSLLSVTAKAATVVANSKSKTYGDVNPALDAVVTGTVNGDTLAYTLATTATATSGIGSYPISVTLGSNPNYSVTPTDSSLTVATKSASVVANVKTKTYGAANPVLDAVVTGTVNGDILAYSLATTATVTSGVGSYPITVTLGSNPNYSLLFTNSLLNVTAKT